MYVYSSEKADKIYKNARTEKINKKCSYRWEYRLYFNYMEVTGVASYGSLGHIPPPLDFQLFNFWVTSKPYKLWHSTPILSNKTAYRRLSLSLFSVYCMNFVIFLCVTHRRRSCEGPGVRTLAKIVAARVPLLLEIIALSLTLYSWIKGWGPEKGRQKGNMV